MDEVIKSVFAVAAALALANQGISEISAETGTPMDRDLQVPYDRPWSQNPQYPQFHGDDYDEKELRDEMQRNPGIGL